MTIFQRLGNWIDMDNSHDNNSALSQRHSDMSISSLSEKVTLETLPAELIHLICEYLDVKGYCALCLASPLHQQIAKEQLYRRLDCTSDIKSPVQLYETLDCQPALLDYIEWYRAKAFCQVRILHGKPLPKLAKLFLSWEAEPYAIEGVINSTLSHIFKHQNLRVLEITSTKVSRSMRNFLSNLNELWNLKYLWLNQPFAYGHNCLQETLDSLCCPSLEFLGVDHVTNWKIKLRPGFDDVNPNLRAMVVKEVEVRWAPPLLQDILDTLRMFEEHSILVDVKNLDRHWIAARILHYMRSMAEDELMALCKYTIDSQIHCENVWNTVYLGSNPSARTLKLDLRGIDPHH